MKQETRNFLQETVGEMSPIQEMEASLRDELFTLFAYIMKSICLTNDVNYVSQDRYGN
jgi:hypothetical protein